MHPSPLRECQLDGLVGPTHNYGGLSHGNVASTKSGGEISSPRAAALEGLSKMRFVRSLGVAQAVLPPHERPSLPFLRQVGYRGADEAVLAAAAADHGAHYLRLASSASAMWTANAATVVPSRDAEDGRVHFVVANLACMPHRAIEPSTTARVLRAVFGDPYRFVVHDALPPAFADEGAANHTRLETSRGAVHLFAWGRRAVDGSPATSRFPARQTFEASAALARLHRVPLAACRFPRQHPRGIDAGAFHTDVLAVGSEDLLLLHELAFDDDALLGDLRAALGEGLVVVRATNAELPIEHAIRAYPFNSQLLPVGDGAMVILAPRDAEEDEPSRRFLERVVASGGPVRAVHYIDVRQSMRNGGGPACLRLRVPLEPAERSAVVARVFLDDALDAELAAWIMRRYRDRLSPEDLADPALHRESMEALDELTRILRVGSIYDFQRARAA